MKPPLFLVFPITYHCNCKCKMCTIWEKQATIPDIPLDLLDRIFSEPLLAGHLKYINLTGGEPFLRKDLIDLVKMFIRNIRNIESFTIATNGLLSDGVVDKTLEILQLLPAHVSTYWSLSLDGPKEIHDEIRGREGCFDAVVETAKRLKQLKEKFPKFDLGFNTTISRFNYRHIREIQRIGEELGVGVGYTTANVVDTFIDSAHSAYDFALRPEEKLELVEFFKELDHKWPNPYWKMVVHMLHGGKRTLTCLARQQGVLIDGDGSVYHCGQSSTLALGNIYRQDFQSIWNGWQARKVSWKIWKECRVCLTNCYPAETWKDHLKKLFQKV